MTVCYRVRMNVRTNLLLSEDLVKEVDHFAGPRGRSRYVTEALEARLKRDRQRLAFQETFGALSTADYPHWSTSEDVATWVRERRLESTDPGLEGPDVPDPGLDVRHRPPSRRAQRSRQVGSDVRGG
jgi:hypothetical protein